MPQDDIVLSCPTPAGASLAQRSDGIMLGYLNAAGSSLRPSSMMTSCSTIKCCWNFTAIQNDMALGYRMPLVQDA
jgi:hypothetical protein